MTELPAIDIDVELKAAALAGDAAYKELAAAAAGQEAAPDYLAGCLNAYEPNSWQQAVAIRAEWDRQRKI